MTAAYRFYCGKVLTMHTVLARTQKPLLKVLNPKSNVMMIWKTMWTC